MYVLQMSFYLSSLISTLRYNRNRFSEEYGWSRERRILAASLLQGLLLNIARSLAFWVTSYEPISLILSRNGPGKRSIIINQCIFHFFISIFFLLVTQLKTSSQTYWKPSYMQRLLYWEGYNLLSLLKEHFVSKQELERKENTYEMKQKIRMFWTEFNDTLFCRKLDLVPSIFLEYLKCCRF